MTDLAQWLDAHSIRGDAAYKLLAVAETLEDVPGGVKLRLLAFQAGISFDHGVLDARRGETERLA